MTSAADELRRRHVIDIAETVVIKLGTNVLARPDDSLDLERITTLAASISAIRDSGRQVVVVSSGAVSAGMGVLGLTERPADLPHLQAAAAAGQAQLIRYYDEGFRPHGFHAGQVLVTANDFRKRGRYLNVRNTLETLLEYNVVPIVNENDTVSIDEIKFGDNDHLASMVASLFEPSLLIILSNVDGLYDGDPDDASSQVIPTVEVWESRLESLVAEAMSSRGTGGMRSKLRAIRLATSVGENVILANGLDHSIIDRVMNGEQVGTLFLATEEDLPAWKRWIGYTMQPHGRLTLDSGACNAIVNDGRSLLAAGVIEVTGEFTRGEVIAMCAADGTEIARGLTNYAAADLRQIAGRRTSEIQQILGSVPFRELVHRNNMVVTQVREPL